MTHQNLHQEIYQSPRAAAQAAIRFLEDCPSDAYPSDSAYFIGYLGRELSNALDKLEQDSPDAEKYRVIVHLMECEMQGRISDKKNVTIPVFFEDWADFRSKQTLLDLLQYLKSSEFLIQCGLIQFSGALNLLFSLDDKIHRIIRKLNGDDQADALDVLENFINQLLRENESDSRVKWDESLAAIAFCLEGIPSPRALDILYIMAAMGNSVSARNMARLCLKNRIINS